MRAVALPLEREITMGRGKVEQGEFLGFVQSSHAKHGSGFRNNARMNMNTT